MGDRDIKLQHGTIIGIVVPVVLKHKVILMAVTFIEGTVLISTFQDSFDILEISL